MNMRILLAAAAASAFATAAVAQVSDSADVDVTAKFIAPISITAGNPLNFGTSTTPSAEATITMAPGGGRSTNGAGGLALLETTGNTGSPATFSISAEGGQSFGIAFAHLSPASGYALADYRVSGCSVASATATSTTLTGTGVQGCTLNVGATLTVPAGASGTVDVGQLQTTVTYN